MRRRPTTTGLLLSLLVALGAAPFATWGDGGTGRPEPAGSSSPPAVGPAAPEVERRLLASALADADPPTAPESADAGEPAPQQPAPQEPAPAPIAAATPPPTVAAAPVVTVPPALKPSVGDRALAMIGFPWQRLGYEIVFLGPRPGVRARALRIERRIEVYVRPGDSVRAVAFDVAHELGHAFDFTEMTWDERREWQQARGMDPEGLWYGCSGCTDYATPAGDWAEAFAAWQVGGVVRSELAGNPTPEQLALVARIAA